MRPPSRRSSKIYTARKPASLGPPSERRPPWWPSASPPRDSLHPVILVRPPRRFAIPGGVEKSALVRNAPHPDPGSVPLFQPAPPRPTPGRRRLGLHLALLLLTLFTLVWAGGSYWAPPINPATGTPFDPLELLLRVLGGDGDLFGKIIVGGMPYAVWVFAILLAHEMGHYLACRYYGIPATLPFFIPAPFMLGTLGAVIRIRGRIPSRRALFDVAAAGPIAGFLVALVPLTTGLSSANPSLIDPELHGVVTEHGKPLLRIFLGIFLTPHESIQINALYGAGWVGMLVTSLNLFPVGQLDGGHAAYAVSPQWHRPLTWLTLAGLLGVVLYQAVVIRQVPVYTLWFVILLWMRDRHPRLLDETAPLGPGRSLIAFLLVVIFALSFILVPFHRVVI